VAGYTRQSSADIVATAVVRANPLNLEFDQVLAAFNASSGHKHDGTTAEGAYVPLIADSDALNKVSVDTSNNRVGVFVEVSSAAVEQIRIQDGVITPVTDNDIDLGTSSVEFKDLYLDGTATIDTLQVDESATITANLTVNGNTTLGNAASDTVTVTADVASPLLPSADDTHDLGAVGSEWRNLYIDGTANIDSLVADTADINGGTVDGATIGGASAGAGTFTTLAATSLSLGGTAVTSTAAELNILDGVTSTATELNILDGVTATTAELNIMDGVTATTAELNIMDGVTSTTAELNILDGVTSTTAELNILDGVTSTAAELNKLDGATVTVSEINILDGDTSATSTTVADADRVVMNDNGTMVQVAMTDLAAYLDDEITAMPNLVTTAATTVGALNAGSITSGFGTIDTGSSTITTTGNITGGNIIISDGGNIGSASDTDAIAITSGGNVTLSQNLTVTGNLQVDGTTTTVNSANMTVDDKLIELGNGRTGSASGDAGIVIERGDDANAFIGFDESADKFTIGTGTFTGASTGDLTITTGTLVANIEGNVTGAVTGNASTATALATARTIAGQSFDGTANITIAPTDLTGVNATATELNIMDGGTSATSTTLADADRVVVNDAGTMKQVALTDFETYMETSLDTLSNVTTVGALNSGSITSGFGSIDNGSSAITTTGTITYGSLSDGSITITGFVDEDDMSSNSATLIPTQQSVEARIQAVNGTANNVTGLNATGAELNTVADFSAVSVDTSTAIASNDAILMFDNGNEIGYRDVDLLDTYFSATTKTLTNKTLTSPIVSGLQLSDSGFSVEGSSADANETTVSFTNPTADRTITFPNATGNVAVFATAPTTAISDGSAGHFLKTDGSGTLSFAAVSSDLVADTTPQLGGDLASNGSDILFADSDKAIFGAGSDLQIYHDSSTNKSHITESGSSHLVIQGQEIQFDNASGTSLLNLSSSQVELLHSGNSKLTTESGGISVTGSVIATTHESSGLLTLRSAANSDLTIDHGDRLNLVYQGLQYGEVYRSSGFNIENKEQDADTIFKGNDGGSTITALTLDMSDAGTAIFNHDAKFADNGKIIFGDGSDASIHWNGSSLEFSSEVGDMLIRGNNEVKLQAHTGENFFVGLSNGASTMYYDNSAKLATTSSGVSVTGTAQATGRLEVAGSDTLKLKLQSTGTGLRQLNLSVDDSNSKTVIDSTYSNTGAYPLSFRMGGSEKMLLSTAGALTLNGAYTLPTSDGSANQVLTTNGSGAVTFADAGGGADLYAANESSPNAQPSATGTNAIAIGDGAVSSSTDSFAIGKNSVASTSSNALAVGSFTDATSSGAAAIGYQAQAVTGSYATAISRSYASGADSFAAAIANNTSSYGALGENTIAMGQRAKASDGTSIAIGQDVTSANGSVAIGLDNTASATGTAAFGNHANAVGVRAVALTYSNAGGTDSFAAAIGQSGNSRGAQGAQSVAIGNNAFVEATGAIGLGYYATIGSSGTNAVALGHSYANGNDSFAAVIDNNTNTYGATATNCIAIGKQAKASGTAAIALGESSQGSGAYGIAVGYQAQASGVGSLAMGNQYYIGAARASGGSSIAIGDDARATQKFSTAIGSSASSEIIGKYAFAGGRFAARGDSQGGQFILRADTTDATATVLTTDNATAASTNQIVAASDTCITFDGTITAMQNGAQAYASFRIEGLLVNDGGTTTLANSATTVIDNQSSWVMALSADNTNNALAITCTGEASHNIRWVANIRTTEVTYA